MFKYKYNGLENLANYVVDTKHHFTDGHVIVMCMGFLCNCACLRQTCVDPVSWFSKNVTAREGHHPITPVGFP